MARTGYPLGTAVAGDVATKAMESGKGNYLANLLLYPGENNTSCMQVLLPCSHCRKRLAGFAVVGAHWQAAFCAAELPTTSMTDVAYVHVHVHKT